MDNTVKVKPLGKYLSSITIGDVSFIVWTDEVETIISKFKRREEGHILSISNKKISFSYSPQLNSLVVSDSHTGDFAIIPVG